METSPFQLSRLALAVTNVDAMVGFYESVFQTSFTPMEMGPFKLYTGTLLGMSVMFAPNEIAGVNAEQSRHQFEVLTTDIDGVVERTQAAGGSVRDETGESGPRVVTIVDPDGNTTVFIERT